MLVCSCHQPRQLFRRSIEERQQKAEQLAGAVSSSAAPPTVNVEDYPEPPEVIVHVHVPVMTSL